MRSVLAAFLGIALPLSCASLGQTAASQNPAPSTNQPPTQQAVPAQPTQTDFTSKKGFVLEDETPVRLRLNRTVSSSEAHVGDTVDFEALDDITVNGTLVIPKGGSLSPPLPKLRRSGEWHVVVSWT